MPVTLPFGTWPSTLTPAVMAAGARRISAPVFVREPGGGHAMVWAESRPLEGGRTTLVRRSASAVVTEELAAPWDVGTCVHEYGGRAHVAWDDCLAFVHRPDHSVWWLRRGGEVQPLVPAHVCRLAEPIHDRARSRLIAVAQWPAPRDKGGQPRASLVEISLPGGELRVLREGADFYAAPTLDSRGGRLAWLEWNHPHMPWDAAGVFVADVDPSGSLTAARHVAGDASASAQQPTWSSTGELHFLWERDGAWTLWREREGVTGCVFESRDELGGPLWNLGMRTWGFVDETHVLAARVHEGGASVVRIDTLRGTAETLCTDLPSIGHLATTTAPGLAVIVEGWDGRGSGFRLIDDRGTTIADRDGGRFEALAASAWSHPESIQFPTSEGDTARAWFYAPHHPEHVGPAGALPPLVVIAHGGPTGLALASANLAVQFWTTRGFAVLDVNYRGSTGFGRAYRERLRGMWGVFDVDDCVAGARYVADRGLVDRGRMIIRGASAGGFTVLAALAFHDVFRAGASYYGVSDVATLVTDTHKFESHYDRFLFGEHADPSALWQERSPLHSASRIRAPVIFFQGLDDLAVPPSQTQRMVEALRASGVEAEYHAYAGEGHGFRRAENIIDSWTRESGFYRRVLALD